MDKMTCSISRAVMPSSQDDNSRDTGVPCMTVNPQRPETMCQAASDAAADTVTPNATSAGTPEPAGTSHELRDEPHESMGSYPGSRGKNTDSRGPRSPLHYQAHRASGCMAQAAGPTAWDSGRQHGITNVTVNGTETPLSTPLEGECDAQRCANGARTGQQHSVIVHGKDPSAWTEHCTSCTMNSSPPVPDTSVTTEMRPLRPIVSWVAIGLTGHKSVGIPMCLFYRGKALGNAQLGWGKSEFYQDFKGCLGSKYT
ncbi:hypothetical protein BU15DRAFT_59941 [Melanogaster broomeanus]|nr:hypothetical protein BU15DRAFT_59941 [Melanogaster broomeanus]